MTHRDPISEYYYWVSVHRRRQRIIRGVKYTVAAILVCVATWGLMVLWFTR